MKAPDILQAIHDRAERMNIGSAYAMGIQATPKPKNPNNYARPVYIKSTSAPLATAAAIAEGIGLAIIIVDTQDPRDAVAKAIEEVLPGSTGDENVAKAIDYLTVALHAYKRDLDALAA